MPPDAAHWVIVLFSAVFGGAVGSFLNVVVYRLPNGLSLVAPPSHCPICKTPIRWFDNVPVFGWMMLGGRCRHCRCWIPIRYPLVEALTAAMFAALAIVEDPLAVAYPYHLMLLCTLLCSALIEVDGHRPPLRLFVPALIVGLVTPLVWPTVQPAHWVGLYPTGTANMLDALIQVGAGVVAGGVLWLMMLGWRRIQASASDVARPSAGTFLDTICAGAFLGWTVLPVLVVATLAAYAVFLCLWRGHLRVSTPLSVWLFVVVAALLFWARLVLP